MNTRAIALLAAAMCIQWFVRDRGTVVNVWLGHARVDEFASSVLVDRSLQPLPEYDASTGRLTFGRGSRQISFGRGIEPQEAAAVADAFRQASAVYTPFPANVIDLSPRATGQLVFFGPMALVIALSVLPGVDLPTWVLVAVGVSCWFLSELVTTRKLRRRPRLLEMEASGSS